MLALLLAQTASADCMMSQSFFSAAPTSPGQATAFFFSPPHTESSPTFSVTDSAGQPVTFTAESLGGPMDAWQLDIAASAPGPLTLTADFGPDAPQWRHAPTATLTVVGEWTAPPERTLLGEEQNTFAWACSHQATTDLIVDGPAPVAWAVEWAASEASWQAGARQTAWLPGNPAGFFGGADTASRLELGHVSCLGDTFSWPGRSIVARVVAVDADGRHRPLLDTPTRLTAP